MTIDDILLEHNRVTHVLPLEIFLGVGGPQDFSVSPSSLGTNWVFEFFRTWFGLGLGGFRD